MVADGMGTRKRLRSPFRNASIADKSPAKQRARRSHLSTPPTLSSSACVALGISTKLMFSPSWHHTPPDPMSTCKRLIDDFEGKEEKDVKPSSSGPAKRISTQALVAVETDKPSRQAENDDEDNTNKKNEENDMDEEDEEADERVTIRVHRTLTESFARLTMADRTEAPLDGVSRAPATLASITHLNAFEDIKNGLVYGEGENSNVCWVRKWFDISDRYGLAYQLQDGSIGGYFNDRTSIMRRCVEPDTGSGWKMENEFIYMSYKSTRRCVFRTTAPSHAHAHTTRITVHARAHSLLMSGCRPVLCRGKRQHTERYSMDKFPQELYKKVQLLKYFQKLFDKENKSTSTLVDLAPEEYERTRSARSSVLHVDRWFRRKHATFFRLSNRIVQVRLLLFLLFHYANLHHLISFCSTSTGQLYGRVEGHPLVGRQDGDLRRQAGRGARADVGVHRPQPQPVDHQQAQVHPRHPGRAPPRQGVPELQQQRLLSTVVACCNSPPPPCTPKTTNN